MLDPSKAREYPFNLLDDIATVMNFFKPKAWDYPLPEDFNESLEYVLNTLTPCEKRIILMRYKDGTGFRFIAEAENFTKSRAQQLCQKAVSKMSRPSRQEYLRYGISEIAKQKERERLNKEAEEQTKSTEEKIRNIPVSKLNFSTRAYNALLRGDCHTLGDITEKSLRDLKKINNIGNVTYNEIKDKIHEYGLKFHDEDSEI